MRSKSAKRMVGKWINVPKRQDFRFCEGFRTPAAVPEETLVTAGVRKPSQKPPWPLPRICARDVGCCRSRALTAPRSSRPAALLRVRGRLCEEVGTTAGVPQIAADLLRCPSRQERAQCGR